MSQKPFLVSKTEAESYIDNYAESAYKRRYVLDGKAYYFSVNPAFHKDGDELIDSDYLFIVVLHPKGLDTVVMTLNDNDAWKPNEEDMAKVDSDILELIANTLCDRNM